MPSTREVKKFLENEGFQPVYSSPECLGFKLRDLDEALRNLRGHECRTLAGIELTLDKTLIFVPKDDERSLAEGVVEMYHRDCPLSIEYPDGDVKPLIEPYFGPVEGVIRLLASDGKSCIIIPRHPQREGNLIEYEIHHNIV